MSFTLTRVIPRQRKPCNLATTIKATDKEMHSGCTHEPFNLFRHTPMRAEKQCYRLGVVKMLTLAYMRAVHSSRRSHKLSLSLIMFSTLACLVFIDEYLSDKSNI